ncbi:hypothetical protein K457DRAFT_1864845 [Linnemannia elongata AG-77]|uniref:Uncharacterized protein n=1 Tax=Linnemannia elongata AG-77 TaxID=1314771 RepID=A0A197JVY8_9FUNG|nr:hypothetical protein K457DRAFT_1864845 [Linnemannia elongata AG-77]
MTNTSACHGMQTAVLFTSLLLIAGDAPCWFLYLGRLAKKKKTRRLVHILVLSPPYHHVRSSPFHLHLSHVPSLVVHFWSQQYKKCFIFEPRSVRQGYWNEVTVAHPTGAVLVRVGSWSMFAVLIFLVWRML